MLWWLAACRHDDPLEIGAFTVELDADHGAFSIRGPDGARLDDVRLLSGTGDATIEVSFGAFRFTDVSLDVTTSASLDRADGLAVPVYDPAGDALGALAFARDGDALTWTWSPSGPHDRVGFSAACDPDDHFLGLGSHVDVDHVGEAFPLWTSEPGIGKGPDEALPDDWPLGGPRHATSLPYPFVLRPHHPDGLLLDVSRRVDADLCADGRYALVAWDDGPLRATFFAGGSPLGTVRALREHVGRAPPPPSWVFGAWVDAIRGSDRVREVRDELVDLALPVSVVWTEDWKGGTDTVSGYRLSEEWRVDRTTYPDVEAVADELADLGVKWLAYFAPFVAEGDETWDSAVAADALVRREDGSVYTFTGASLKSVGLVDPSGPGRAWAVDQMRAAVDLGFDGWMTDYGEWLPADAAMADGSTGLEAHAGYPEAWQEISREALDGVDGTFFARSGWTRTPALAPVIWAGDQRTDFQPDDGFPTVIPLGLGASIAGVPLFAHDIAGYQSLGNPPSDAELWFRWCALGAFTPVMRTHHGSQDLDDHQWDQDPDTLAFFGRMAREHAKLEPYLAGLAAGPDPLVLPVAFFHGDDWGRADAWMLGPSLLVAPVQEAGVTARAVALPDDVRWFDWWTGAEAHTGTFPAPLDTIPVFAAGGTTVPTLAEAPGVGARFADVDGARVVYLLDGGGPFDEADGTAYRTTGSGTGTATATVRSGSIAVGGLTLTVDGPVERTYTVIAR
ncbi:MAG: TIM-barrel domain-containing protein [Myxococcota bacterium]